MPATIINSTIFGNVFSTEAMGEVWSDENRTSKYLPRIAQRPSWAGRHRGQQRRRP